MANCSSSILAPKAELFPSERSEIKNRTLPPRKRLLASLKNVALSADKLSGLPSRMTDDDDYNDAQAIDVAEKDPSKSCLDVNNEKAAVSQSLPQSLSIEKCTSCGDSDLLVHRVADLTECSSWSFYCSPCILSSHKRMYCFLCLQIIEKGFSSSTTSTSSSSSSSSSSSFLLSCCKCQRYSHRDCARKLCPSSFEGCDLFLCDECRGKDNCNNIRRSHIPELQSKRRKKASIDSAWQDPPSSDSHCRKKTLVDQETLTAARVVAALAEKEAYKAKQRALEMARLAASATLQAQIALDTAYDVSHTKVNGDIKQDDHIIMHHDDQENDVVNSTIKSPRGSKKRALSAIVASEEIYNKKLENHTNSAATIKPVKKRKHMTSGVHTAAYFSDDDEDHTYIPNMKYAKGNMKRKKSLSTIGVEMNSVLKYKGSNFSGSKSKATKLSTKGKLGVILSRALALGKGEKKSLEASHESTDLHAKRDPLEPKMYQKNAAHSKGHMPKTSIASGSDSFQHDSFTSNYDRAVKMHQGSSSSIFDKSKANPGEKNAQPGIKKPTVNGAVVSEQERRLFEFLNKTLESSKVALAKIPTAASIAQKR